MVLWCNDVMGSVLALFRAPLNQPGNEESSQSQVQFPPRSGCYFGSYFIMGGEHFNTGRNDAYLFGEPNDLTFLNRRPAPFPYPAPAATEPSKTLQSLVNIRRDSIKLVKPPCCCPCNQCSCHGNYTVEFVLDSDVPCVVRVLTSVREEAVVSSIRDPSVKHWCVPAGLGQQFCQTDLTFTPAEFPHTMFKWNNNQNDPIPLIIHVNVEVEFQNHAHFVFCMFEKSSDNSFSIKVLKQKQNIDGISFILQEIYGMESKGSTDKSVGNGECVVCLNAPRDTMILPCRHLCLCYTCADDVRFKSNVCLMCRQPFRALLRIEALQRVVTDESDGKTETEERFEHVDLVQYKCNSSTGSRSRMNSEISGGAVEAGPSNDNNAADNGCNDTDTSLTQPGEAGVDEAVEVESVGFEEKSETDTASKCEEEEPTEFDRSSSSTLSPVEI